MPSRVKSKCHLLQYLRFFRRRTDAADVSGADVDAVAQADQNGSGRSKRSQDG